MSLEEYRRLDEDQNIGTFLCLKWALQAMSLQRPEVAPITQAFHKGSIVIVTSPASEGSLFGLGNYIAAKNAMQGLVQTAGIFTTSTRIHTCLQKTVKHSRAVNAVSELTPLRLRISLART